MGKVKKHKKHHHQDKSEEAPLKLRIKVGSSDAVESEDGHRHRHHKKKKKKKHREHHHKEKVKKEQYPDEVKEEVIGEAAVKSELADDEAGGEDSVEMEDAPSVSSGDEQGGDEAGSDQEMSNVTSPAESNTELATEKVEVDSTLRAMRGKKIKTDEDITPLQQCLDFIHQVMQRKDTNGFFSYPVTDSIAPGYSSIISHPMDLSTMKEKIEYGEYSSLAEYKRDFKIMCENCMVYNRPETIYYREAKRLWIICTKQMSKDKLALLRRSVSIFTTLTDQELGLGHEEPTDFTMAPLSPPLVKPASKQKKIKPSKFEAIPDNLTPEEILAEAQAMARHASESLTMRKPNSKIGFLRRKKDGTVSMTILNPENEGIVSETERVVNLGSLTGKLTAGAGSIAGFKEDKRNKATPVTYLNYGPFSSYAPVYDSTMSSLNKEDSDLLISTYGDDTTVDYATSLKSFVSDAGEFAVKMVDNLLDILTNGEHSKSAKVLGERAAQRAKEEENEEKKDTTDTKEEKLSDINFESLRSLSGLGIDTTFLDTFEKQARSEQVQAKLDETSKLLSDLEKAQHSRLGQKPPTHLASIPGPSEIEASLAKKVTQELTELAKQVGPVGVSTVAGIRNALGITLGPVEGAEGSEGDKDSTTPETGEESMDVQQAEADSSSQDDALPTASNTNTDNDLEKDLEEFLIQGTSDSIGDTMDALGQDTTS